MRMVFEQADGVGNAVGEQVAVHALERGVDREGVALHRLFVETGGGGVVAGIESILRFLARGEVWQVPLAGLLKSSAWLLLEDLIDQVDGFRPVFALLAPFGVVEPLLRQRGIVFRVLIERRMEIEAGHVGGGPGRLPPFGGIGDPLLDLVENFIDFDGK